MSSIAETRQERAAIIENARKAWDVARADCEKNKREPTVEERSALDKAMADADVIKKKIDAMEADEARGKALRDAAEELQRIIPAKVGGKVTAPDKPAEARGRRTVELRKSVTGVSRDVELDPQRDTAERRAAFNRFLVSLDQTEMRALQKDSDPAGGYLSPPMEFQAELIRAIDDAVIVRQIANVLPPLMTASTLGAPALDTMMAAAQWGTELTSGTADTTMAFGRRELAPHPSVATIKVSKKLLRNSAVSADSIVRDELARVIGELQETAFLSGTGVTRPLGVFTASASGINTDRDVSTGNTTTEMRFDGLINAQMAVHAQYRNAGSWIFHRDGIKQLRTIKDGEGRYIWQASALAGEPDVLLGNPVYESEFSPNTFTTGLYVGIFGDFSKYWIVDALTLTIEVADQLLMATNQNQYFARSETDGMPVFSAAFARVKLA